MLDDLRQQALSDAEEKQAAPAATSPQKAAASAPKARKRSRKVLGMTGPQRFAISFMLLLMVCVTGFMFLFITNKIGF